MRNVTGRRAVGLAVVGLVLVLAAAACQRPDAGDGIATAGGAAPATTAPGDGLVAPPGAVEDPWRWAKCMREQGIQVSDPDPEMGDKAVVDMGSVEPRKLRAARQACLRFNANWGKRPPPTTPEELERERQWARCMRANGVDVPDPQPGTDDSRAELPTGDTIPGEVVNRADAACRSKIPGMPPPPSTPPGGKK